MQRKIYFDTSLPQEELKKFIIQGLGKRRREHKYELKRGLNLQPDETPEGLIESVDPDNIVNRDDFVQVAHQLCDPKVQAKAKKNKESRGKQVLLHTSGSKSFARSAFEDELITGRAPDRGQLFVKTHKHKDGAIGGVDVTQTPSSRGSTQGTIHGIRMTIL
ncbi:hypothetical protein SLA2020_426280 [Shorea laevis]